MTNTMRAAPIALMLALVSAVGHAEDAASLQADWASQNINLPALKTWGTKHYTYSGRDPGSKVAKIFGTVRLSTEVTDEAVILNDKFQITYKGEKMSLDIIHTCRKDNFLSPTRIESKGEGTDEFGSFVATVADGKARVLAKDGSESVNDVPEGTITMAAMMRLVTLVSRTPGKSYSYEYSLESEEMNLKKKYRLEVLPPETITSGGRQMQCSKFKLHGGGNPIYYWVTEDGVLQRMMVDERKIIELDATR